MGKHITSGVKQWADYSINFQTGCKYGCRFCYAMFDAVSRWKRVESYEEWCKPKHNEKAFKKYSPKEGRGMFPTTHDIYSENLHHVIGTLYSLLRSGRNILITTKPNLNSIETICNLFKDYKDQIQFRFTITHSDIRNWWEPNAPSYNQRIRALEYAFSTGYKTSLSMEPYLENPLEIINDLEVYITESIWVGVMNPTKILPRFKEEYNKLKEIYSKSYIIKHLDSWKEAARGKLRLKDSIKNMLNGGYLM